MQNCGQYKYYLFNLDIRYNLNCSHYAIAVLSGLTQYHFQVVIFHIPKKKIHLCASKCKFNENNRIPQNMAHYIETLLSDFKKHYASCDYGKLELNQSHFAVVDMTTQITYTNDSHADDHSDYVCSPETSILFLFLMLCTVWLGLTLFRFTKTYVINISKKYTIQLCIKTRLCIRHIPNIRQT